jgi:hypothetical protein
MGTAMHFKANSRDLYVLRQSGYRLRRFERAAPVIHSALEYGLAIVLAILCSCWIVGGGW